MRLTHSSIRSALRRRRRPFMQRGPLERAWLIVSAIAMALLVGLGAASLLGLLTNATRGLDRYLVQVLTQQLHRPVKIGTVEVLRPGRIRVTGLQVAAGPTFASGVMISAPETVVQYRLWDLVRGRVSPLGSISLVEINRPYLLIVRDRKNHFNLQELFPPRKPPKPSLFRGLLRVNDGSARFVDYAVRDLPAPQANWLSNVDAEVDAGAPPLMVISGSGQGDGRRAGRASVQGTFQPEIGAFSIRVAADSKDAPYWSRYFAKFASFNITAGQGSATVDVWKPRQRERISATIRVDATGGAGTTQYTRVPLTDVRGSLIVRTGRPLETVLDVTGLAGRVPVRVAGSVFTGTEDARVALRASAQGVTLSELRRILPKTPSLPWITPLAPATASALIYGPPNQMVAVADVQLPRAKLYNTIVTDVTARVRYEDRVVYLPRITGLASGDVVSAEGTVNMRTGALSLIISVPSVHASALGLTRLPLTGDIASRIVVSGTTKAPRAGVLVTVTNGRLKNIPFNRMVARVSVSDGTLLVENAVAELPGAVLLARGTVDLKGPLDMRVNATGVRLGRLLPAAGYQGISGTAFFQGHVGGTLANPLVQGQAGIYNARLRGQTIDYAVGHVTASRRRVWLDKVRVARIPAQAIVSGTATMMPSGQIALDMRGRVRSGRIENLMRDAGFTKKGAEPAVVGNISTPNDVIIGGTLASPRISGRVVIANAYVSNYPVDTATANFSVAKGAISLSNVEAASNTEGQAGSTRLTLGRLRIVGNRITMPEPFTVQNIDLSRFAGLGSPYVQITGIVSITGGTVSGTTSQPVIASHVAIPALAVNGEAFQGIGADVQYRTGAVRLTNLTVSRQGAQVLSVPRADWNEATGAVAAQLRSASLNIGLLIGMLRKSDWLYMDQGRQARAALEGMAREHVLLDAASLSVGRAAENGGTSGDLSLRVANGALTMDGVVVLRGAQIRDKRLDRLSLAGAVRDLRRQDGRWSGAIEVPPDGFQAETAEMTVNGGIDAIVGGEIRSAGLDAINVPLAYARLFLPADRAAQFDRTAVAGTLTVRVDASGSWAKPEMLASVSGNGITVGQNRVPISLRSSAIAMRNTPEGAVIEPTGPISILAQNHSIRFDGRVPFDWATKTIPDNRPLTLTANVEEQPLDILNLVFGKAGGGPITEAKGTIAGQLTLDGSVRQPHWGGMLKVNDGSITLRSLDQTFRNIALDMRLNGSNLVVNALQMDSSRGGSLAVQKGGTIGLPPLNGGLSDLRPDLALALNGFRVVEKPNALGYNERVSGTLSTPANAPLLVTAGANGPLIKGEILLSDADAVPPSITPTAKGEGRSLAAAPSFDLNLVVGKNVQVHNALFRVAMADRGNVADRSVRITGTPANPRVYGRLTSHDGTLFYPTARFRLTDATIRVHYPAVENVTEAGSTQPDLLQLEEGSSSFSMSANAQARLTATVNGQRQPITVYMHIEGPSPTISMASNNNEGAFGSLAPYRITLRSSPSLPERQLVALITREAALQRIAEGGNPEDILRQETMNILQASVLPEALAGFESRLGQAFGLEALTLDYTMMNNTLSVTATKRITNRLSLTYSRPLGAATTSQNSYTVSLSYQIKPRLQLTLQQQRNPGILGIQQTVMPGPQSTVTENSILLEGSFPF